MAARKKRSTRMTGQNGATRRSGKAKSSSGQAGGRAVATPESPDEDVKSLIARSLIRRLRA